MPFALQFASGSVDASEGKQGDKHRNESGPGFNVPARYYNGTDSVSAFPLFVYLYISAVWLESHAKMRLIQ